MAYMDQQRKATIAAELKKVAPAGWKYTLGVDNRSTIVMTISQAPIDLIGLLASRKIDGGVRPSSFQLNTHYPLEAFTDQEVGKAFAAIVGALNAGNHDRSDTMTDYFDVGWYVSVNIGRWDKPFAVIEQGDRA